MPRKKKKTRYYSVVKNYNYSGRLSDVKNRLRKVNAFIVRKPFTSFFAVLLLLFLLIIGGNLLLAPKSAVENKQVAKKVETYKLGSAPKLKFHAQVEKSGVIKIVAFSPGVVQFINVTEGQDVGVGENLINLSSNYSGGNILAISREIAQNQYNLAKDTYKDQKDLIAKQKETAIKSSDNASQLRDISSKSAEETKSLLDLNQSLLDKINSDLEDYISSNVGGVNDNLIFQTKQVKAQLQSAVTQLSAQLRGLEYQASSDKPPAQLGDLQKDIALKQLEIQEKSLAVGLEISRLSYNLALVNEATMHPTSPFAGRIDRIYVKEGQSVNPGTVLLSLSGTTQHVKVIAKVPANTARNISMIEDSVININNSQVKIRPSYVSKDATDGQLYSVVYQLNDIYKDQLTDTSFVTIDIPIGTGNTNNYVPFVPLDSVFQTQEEAFVFVVGKNNVATVRKVKLGEVQGRFVEVLSGIDAESTVILTRNVLEGDKVETN
ncbi:biotin/lipoyl-binding protein [Patescibacteria group bacterium]|nr:biotin/lipoyl-binding protein [Patescibacteria group bacterium]